MRAFSSSYSKFILGIALPFLPLFLAGCTDSSETDGSGLYSSSCISAGNCADELAPKTSGFFLTPKAEMTRMECTHDHIQVGGVCEIDGAVDSYIEYSLTQNGNPVDWAPAPGASQNTRILREARCENGRYHLIIPRPLNAVILDSQRASVCPTTSCFVEYQLNSRIFALKKGASQYEVVATAPILPFSIQMIINTGSAQVCPD